MCGMKRLFPWIVATVFAGLLSACVNGGSDSVSGPIIKSATLYGGQVSPPVLTSASGTSTITVDMQSGKASGSVNLTGISASAVTINSGAVGSTGAVVINLFETFSGSGIWSVPASAQLSGDQINQFANGGMYLNAASALYPNGQIRGQLGLDVRTANLTGTQVNPSIASVGAGNAILSADATSLAFGGVVTVSGVTATAVRIQDGALGVNGGSLISLTESPIGSGNWFVPAGSTLTASQLASFQAGTLYVVATSTANPNGELRGQIGRIVIDSAMNAGQEVPVNASIGTAAVRVSIDPISRLMNGTITTTNMPTANNAHIHTGLFGVNGGVTYPFTQTAPNAATWTMAATTLTTAQYQTVLFGNTYANVHSPAFPGGEIRGQVGKVVRTGFLTSAQEVPANASAATARVRVDVDPQSLDVNVALTTTGITATVAHIHLAPSAVNGPVIIPFVQVTPGNWTAVPGSKMTSAQLASYASGGTYANVHSTQFPGGEIRVQLVGVD